MSLKSKGGYNLNIQKKKKKCGVGLWNEPYAFWIVFKMFTHHSSNHSVHIYYAHNPKTLQCFNTLHRLDTHTYAVIFNLQGDVSTPYRETCAKL